MFTDFPGKSSITVSLPEVAFTTTTGRQGCNTINIQFVNQSSNAGFTCGISEMEQFLLLKTQCTPYLDPGHYGGVSHYLQGEICASTLNYPECIRVDTAHADFTMTGNSICAL